MEQSEQEKSTDPLQELHNALAQDDLIRVHSMINAMYPADIALLLESLPQDERITVWDLVDPEHDGEVLTYVNENVRATLMREMESHELVAATENLPADDLADLLPEMPEDVIQQVLSSMDEQNRARFEAVLSYDEDSAGGLMNTDTVTVRADINLDVVMRYLRLRGIPEATDSLMVVNREGKYLGVLSLTTLLTSDPSLLVDEVMDHEVEGIQAKTSAADVANLFERRDLITAPVVNEDGFLLGRITIDDVVDVIRDTADHSFLGMAGLTEEEDIFAPVIASSRRRALWLGVNLLTAFIASWVIGLFEATIEQLVALAVLMPVVASMGGIAGSQTLTLVIRAMALGQITRNNSRRLLRKELTVAILNGVIWSLVIALVAILWFKSVALGIVIAAAILINLFFAALSGATMPLLLQRFGADPALAGGVLLTTVTDVVGFFAFLGLAALFLI